MNIAKETDTGAWHHDQHPEGPNDTASCLSRAPLHSAVQYGGPQIHNSWARGSKESSTLACFLVNRVQRFSSGVGGWGWDCNSSLIFVYIQPYPEICSMNWQNICIKINLTCASCGFIQQSFCKSAHTHGLRCIPTGCLRPPASHL